MLRGRSVRRVLVCQYATDQPLVSDSNTMACIDNIHHSVVSNFVRNIICVVAGLGLWCCLTRNANAEAGHITKTVSGCDYFIIDAPSGYVVAEWYGGHDPHEGEGVVGAFNSYGFLTFFYGSEKTEGRVYIEDYGLDEDEAMEKLSEQCN
jgi:hypothetical protein